MDAVLRYMFSQTGRIGRLEYLGMKILLNYIIAPIGITLSVMLIYPITLDFLETIRSGMSLRIIVLIGLFSLIMLCFLLMILAFIYCSIVMTVKRLHDLGWGADVTFIGFGLILVFLVSSALGLTSNIAGISDDVGPTLNATGWFLVAITVLYNSGLGMFCTFGKGTYGQNRFG